MAKKKTLRQQAIEQRELYYKVKRRDWWATLHCEQPKLADDMKELVQSWRGGDKELRRAYPTRKSLARFLCDVANHPVSVDRIDVWIGNQ